MRTHGPLHRLSPLLSFTGEETGFICPMDARHPFNFKEMISKMLDDLIQRLPKDGKFLIRWIPEDPNATISKVGKFVAFSSQDPEQTDAVKIEYGDFFESLKK